MAPTLTLTTLAGGSRTPTLSLPLTLSRWLEDPDPIPNPNPNSKQVARGSRPYP